MVLLSAQAQFGIVVPYLAILISIIGITYTVKSFNYKRREDKLEAEKKMATKDYVLDKVTNVDVSVLNVSKELSEYKHSNEREHDAIRKDVSEKLDLIITLIKKDKK